MAAPESDDAVVGFAGRPAPAASVACPGGTLAGFMSGARKEWPAVMHLLFPPPVGIEDFCMGDEFTVYDAN